MNCPVCNKLFSKKSGLKGDKAELMCNAVSDILHNRVIRRVVATSDGIMLYLKVEATYKDVGAYTVKHGEACRCNTCRVTDCKCSRCCTYCNSVGKLPDGGNCNFCSWSLTCKCR